MLLTHLLLVVVGVGVLDDVLDIVVVGILDVCPTGGVLEVSLPVGALDTGVLVLSCSMGVSPWVIYRDAGSNSLTLPAIITYTTLWPSISYFSPVS